MKNTILLVAGAVVTLLFLVFATPTFEALYYERAFSDAMYNSNLYFIVSVMTTVMAWGVAAIYYYVVNSVSFSRWYHWLVALGVACVLAGVAGYVVCNNSLSAEGYDFSAQLFSFALVDVAIEAVLFTIVSFSIRWWSSNCRHTPIPE